MGDKRQEMKLSTLIADCFFKITRLMNRINSFSTATNEKTSIIKGTRRGEQQIKVKSVETVNNKLYKKYFYLNIYFLTNFLAANILIYDMSAFATFATKQYCEDKMIVAGTESSFCPHLEVNLAQFNMLTSFVFVLICFLFASYLYQDLKDSYLERKMLDFVEEELSSNEKLPSSVYFLQINLVFC